MNLDKILAQLPPNLTKAIVVPGGVKLWGGSALILLGTLALIVGGAGIYLGTITVGGTQVGVFWIGVAVIALAIVLVVFGIRGELQEGSKRAEGDSKPKT